jgi:hypothetical protein
MIVTTNPEAMPVYNTQPKSSESPIRHKVDIISSRVDAISSALNHLNQKFEPVLCPPMPRKQDNSNPASGSLLESLLHDIELALRDVYERLEDTIDRCQL